MLDMNTALELMENNLDSQNEPMLGTFWYDKHNDELFGIRSVYADEVPYYESSIFKNKVKTSKLLHKTIWTKEHFRGKDKRFNGDYTKTPRGRIFEVENEGFVVCVGSWIKDCPNVFDLVIEEFQLPKDQTKIMLEDHWELGNGFE